MIFHNLILFVCFFFCNTFSIRVLLDKKELNPSDIYNIVINNENGIVVNDCYQTRESFFIPKDLKTIEFILKNNNWYLNEKKLGIKNILISPPINFNTISINGKKYEGVITVIIKNKTLYIINEISLESYIEGVLASETYHDWPHESHRVSAIIARTYALEKILRNTENIYDINSTIIDQKYDGISNNKNLQRAVNETKGIIITKNHKPIIAMYTSCCGGVIPAQCRGIDFKKYPYLARNYQCNYCKESSSFSWKVLITKEDLKTKLTSFLKKTIHSIQSIHSIGKTKSGTIAYVEFKIIFENNTNQKNNNKKINYTSKIIRLSNRDIRQLFSLKLQYNSAHFSLDFNINAGLIIKGNGMGHHLGLCQWGAKNMANSGKSYHEILKYYYPNTYLSSIDTTQL
jgi:stage II sporulation protein D